MAPHGKMLIALAVSLLALSLAAEVRALGRGLGAPQCGQQAGNKKCRDGLCCSEFGFCGDTEPYCGEGCQSQCSSEVRALGRGLGAPQCGQQAGNKKCRDGLCCSEFGFCGDTEPYCGEGCQSQCSSEVRALGRGLGAPQCGQQAGNKKCRDGLCCSEFGFCGDTEPYCGEGCQSQCSSEVRALSRGLGAPQCGQQAGNKKCRDGLCCSEFGFCGDTEPYCGEGCQSQCSSEVRALSRGLGAPQCGQQAGNKKCRDGLCCSEFGFCGDTEPYCGEGCQSQCSSEVRALSRGLGAPQCGQQAGNKKCRDGLCCSEFGFCGDTEPYCGEGCQSQCSSEVRALGRGLGAPQCGQQAGNKKCRDGLCCSEFGFCGDTEPYCGEGCQSQCSSEVRALSRGLGAPQCGQQAGNKKCRDGLCCSEFGFCGDTEPYCGEGCQSQCSSEVRALGRGLGAPQCGQQAGNKKCRDGLCCSEFGFCGDTEPYCGEGCQSQCSSEVRALSRGLGAPQCGQQAGNKKCRDGLCCSEFGFCGDTEPYCGEGCQSQCSSEVRALSRGLGAPQCGQQAGNKKCRDGLCCSEFGFCGDTEPYCGEGCQSQCSSEVRALGRGLGAPQCGQQAGNKKCRDGLCCSEFGFCGDTEPYCGEGCQSQCSSEVRALSRGLGAPQCGQQAGNKKCRDGLCCSEFGFCGDTEPYCGEGCQSQCSSEVRALSRGLGAPQCGQQAGNKKCRDGLCCSEFGFCGDTEPYCGEGCQSQCSSEVRALGRGLGAPQCGQQAGNKKCRDGLCCSEFGFCGDTEPYCGEGCQSQCSSEVRALDRGLGAPQCGQQAGNKKCRDGLCCSEFGFCGDTEPYCGEGCQSQCSSEVRALGRGLGAPQCGQQAGNKKCRDGLCCSEFGYCGDTEYHCGEGCQSQCPSDNCLRGSTGKASFYNTAIPSACYGNDESHFPRNQHMAAVSDGNPNLWKNGEGCGKHYRIRCQGNGCRNGDAITVKVVDRCPNGCQGRVFDLSEEAFGAIADKNAGVIKVQYEPVNNANEIPWELKELIAEVGQIRK